MNLYLRLLVFMVPMGEVLELVRPLTEHLAVPTWVTQRNEGSSRHGCEL